MSAGHTEGPWRVMPPDLAINAWVIADVEGGSVADCSPPGPWMRQDEADANARLIATAPELLRFVYCVLEYEERVHAGLSSPFAEEARKLIAKAATP